MDNLMRWYRFLFNWTDVVQQEIATFLASYQSPALIKAERKLTDLSLQSQIESFQLPPCPAHNFSFKDAAAHLSVSTGRGRRSLAQLERLLQEPELHQEKSSMQGESIEYLEARVEALEAMKREKLKEKIKSLEEELSHE